MLPQLRPGARRRNGPPALPSASWRSAPTSFNGSCLPQRRRAHGASRGSRHASTLVRRSVSSQLSRCALVRLGCRTAQATARNRLPCARAPACPGLLLLCALTSHSSRRRFAARLNSGVRPLGAVTVVVISRSKLSRLSVSRSHSRDSSAARRTSGGNSGVRIF